MLSTIYIIGFIITMFAINSLNNHYKWINNNDYQDLYLTLGLIFIIVAWPITIPLITIYLILSYSFKKIPEYICGHRVTSL